VSSLDQISTRLSLRHASTVSSTNGGILQRKCACGASSSSGGSCEECKEKNQKPETGGAFRAGWGPDFRQIPIRSAAERLSSEPSGPAIRSNIHGDAGEATARSEKVKKQEFYCPPVADTITNISTAAAGGGTLGLTKFATSNQLVCFPPTASWTIDEKAGYGTFKPVTVNLDLVSKFPSVTASPLPTSDSMQLPDCGNKQVPIFMEITKPTSDLVKAGEQEHCDDLNLAFAQTLVPCAAAVNKFAGQKIPGKDLGGCIKSLTSKLGFDPVDCTEEFTDMTAKDKSRDDNGFHDFDPDLKSKTCDKIVIGNKPAASNKINDKTVAPGKFIPASTKCPKPGGTKPAAPGGSGSGSGAPPPVPPVPAPKKEEKAK
jgi:hypothetical protein